MAIHAVVHAGGVYGAGGTVADVFLGAGGRAFPASASGRTPPMRASAQGDAGLEPLHKEDPISGKAAVIYTDSTIDTWTSPSGVTKELPEIVLAFEK